jgi:uncharacterized membrane protein YphA (DoxX/SURF4 family)
MSFLTSANAPRGTIFIRIAGGLIFFTHGCSFCLGCAYALQQGSAADHHLDRGCDHQDPGVDSLPAGLLIHGARCAHRFAMLMCLLFLVVSGSGPWSGSNRKR